jgi:hypothetical protein
MPGLSRVALSWFALREGRYVPLEPDERGIIRSEVFPGLWLVVPALLRGDLARVLATLRRGMRSPEYKAFVARLKEASPRPRRGERTLRKISAGGT